MQRDIVIALSLANLSFISAWRSLLTPASFFYYYHQKNLPSTVEYLSLIVAVILVALLLLIGIRLVRTSNSLRVKSWANRVFILSMSAPLYGLLSQLDNNFVLGVITKLTGEGVDSKRLLVSTLLAITLTVIVVGLAKIRTAVRVAIVFLLVLSPLVLITFTQAIFYAVKYRSANTPAPFIASANQHKGPRVLWFVFDEFDFRVAFVERDKSVRLPNIDRLSSESLFANYAYPPAGETLLSLPSLIIGKVVTEAHPEGPEQLMLKLGDDKPAVSWKDQPNVFSRARDIGVNSALVGWYHPYCRVLGSYTAQCDWEGQLTAAEMAQVVRGQDVTLSNDWAGFRRGLIRHAKTALFTFPLVTSIFEHKLDVQQLERDKDNLDFERTYDMAVAAANNRELGLVFIHWPIPHFPNIYDRSSHQISTAPNHSYLDNLALVDETIGKIRESMEANGTWDDAAVLVTSDHWWRSVWRKEPGWTKEDENALGNSTDTRIPFIVKMPGTNNRQVIFQPPFNTVLSSDLVLAILQGTITDTHGVAAWLDQHRAISPSR